MGGPCDSASQAQPQPTRLAGFDCSNWKLDRVLLAVILDITKASSNPFMHPPRMLRHGTVGNQLDLSVPGAATHLLSASESTGRRSHQPSHRLSGKDTERLTTDCYDRDPPHPSGLAQGWGAEFSRSCGPVAHAGPVLSTDGGGGLGAVGAHVGGLLPAAVATQLPVHRSHRRQGQEGVVRQ